MMTPQLHMDIARQRQAELRRSADMARLASRASKGEGLLSTLGRRLRSRGGGELAAPAELLPRVTRPAS